MALNRCVKPGARVAAPRASRVAGVGMAGGDDDAGRGEPADDVGVVISGASVTRVVPRSSEVTGRSRSSSSPRSFARRARPCAPREERALDVDAEHAGHACVDRRPHGRDRAATTSRSSLISVGRKPVVPKRRCARRSRGSRRRVGASLNSTPPPPLTWASMKPGSSSSPPRSWRVGALQRGRRRRRPRRCRSPSISTARPSRTRRRQDAAVDQRDWHQTVSVTLCRCGGRRDCGRAHRERVGQR